MTTPLNFVAVVGSLRKASVNRVVFEAATKLIGPDATITEFDLHDVPLYDGDVEAEGDPESVAALKRAVIETDGLLFFTPEYNLSIPAVTKNAIDWLSRVPGDSALMNASVGVVAGSPGRRGGIGARQHLSDSLSRVAGHFYPITLGVASLSEKIEDGRLADPETRQELADWLAAFIDHVKNKPQEDSDD